MNKKEQILSAAIDLLEEKGDAASLNLRKTAKRAGCAHTNVYNYFPSFESLKWAMLEKSLAMLDDYMFGKNGGRSDPIELLSLYIDFALAHPSLYRLIWVTELDQDAAPADTDFLRKTPGRLAGSVDDRRADTVHCYVHGKLLNLIFSRYPAGDIEREKTVMIEVCRELLRA